MSPSSEALPQSNQPNRRRKSLIAATLMLGAAISLSPRIARAAGLTDLSDTLSQTVTNTVNQAINPVGQIINGGSGGWNENINLPSGTGGNGIGGIVNSILGGGGGANFNPFGSIMNTFQSFLNDLLKEVTGNQCGALSENPACNTGGTGLPTGGGTPNANGTITIDGTPINTGALGLPDPTATHSQIDQAAANGGNTTTLQQSDHFNLNPIALAYSVKSESDRVAGRGVAETVIGTQGQAQMQQESTMAAQTLGTIEQTGQDAQNKDVTQDVMKNLASMESANSTLVAGSYAQLMGLRQQTAANGVVTTNISEATDESNRMQHAERMGAAISVLTNAGGLYLPGQTN